MHHASFLKSTLFAHIVQKALLKADLRLKIPDLRKNFTPCHLIHALTKGACTTRVSR